MAESDIQELKKSCAAGSAKSEIEQLAEGETIWFVGRPLASPEGTISLSISRSVTLILRAEDVLDAIKQRDAYLLKTRVGADVMFRQEVVLKADPARGYGCDCNSGTTDGRDGGTATRQPLPPEIAQVPEIPDFFFDWDNPGQCFNDCRWTLDCVPAVAPDGTVYEVCYPAFDCVTRCAPGTGQMRKARTI